MTEGGVAVLLPILDEEEALPGTLSAIPRHPALAEVVVVDNGSRDRSAQVAAAHGATVVTEPQRGYGSACLAGIAHLASRPVPPQVVAFVDGDGRGQAAYLEALLRPILEGEADLSLGSRIPPEHGSGLKVPWHQRTGNRLVLVLVRILFGHRFQDFAPFRAIRMERLQELEMDDRTWGWTVQMQLRALVRGLRIAEVPIPHSGRTEGKSKISGTFRGSVKAGAKMIFTVVRERFRTTGRGPPGGRARPGM